MLLEAGLVIEAWTKSSASRIVNNYRPVASASRGILVRGQVEAGRSKTTSANQSLQNYKGSQKQYMPKYAWPRPQMAGLDLGLASGRLALASVGLAGLGLGLGLGRSSLGLGLGHNTGWHLVAFLLPASTWPRTGLDRGFFTTLEADAED